MFYFAVWLFVVSPDSDSLFLLHDRTLEAAKTIMLDLKYVNNAEDRAIFLTDIEKLKKVSCTIIC